MHIAARLGGQSYRNKHRWMAAFACVCFTLLLLRALQLQTVEHAHYKAAAIDNITRTISVPATRGFIRDRSGRVIAVGEPAYRVLGVPYLLRDRERWETFVQIMHLSENEARGLRARLDRIPVERQGYSTELFRNITRNQLAALATHAAELLGVDIVDTPLRYYPYDALGAHAIGYLNEVNKDDIEMQPGEFYRAGDLIGRTGIERLLEHELRGKAGVYQILVNARGHVLSRNPTESFPALRRERAPQAGKDVVTTLDMELMKRVREGFRGHPSGAAVVVEARTGRVLALYSKPSYSLNEISQGLTHERFDQLNQNPFRPLIDKTVYETYFPGSIFKPFSAIAALQEGVLAVDSVSDCSGYHTLGHRRFRCTHQHGELTLEQALSQSCNVYFYRLAEQVGIDRIAFHARHFGLGERTGIGINSESSGFVPTRRWYRRKAASKFRLGFALNAAIGQGNTRVTLIQVAMAYAALANGGTLYRPQLIESISASDGQLLHRFRPSVRRHIALADEHFQAIRRGLRGTLVDERGTAHRSYNPKTVPVAGKTGTAQVARRHSQKGEREERIRYLNKDHAWFAGFAPYDEPEIAVVVLVEHGGSGGRTAAPIAITIMNEYLKTSDAPSGPHLAKISRKNLPDA